MGDRCYLTITLHGPVETTEKLQATIAALELEALYPNDGNADFYGYFADMGNDMMPAFHAVECNYADISQTETALQALGIPYYVEHDEGGDYSAGCWSWSGDRPEGRQKVEAERGQHIGSVIPTADVVAALESDDPIAATWALVNERRIAEGCDLPEFSMSEEVAAFCKSMAEG